MAMPEQHHMTRDGSLDTLLVAVGELKTQLAVISEQLKAVPDHENRIRNIESAMPANLENRLITLETARARALGGAIASGVLSSSVAGVIIWALSHH